MNSKIVLAVTVIAVIAASSAQAPGMNWPAGGGANPWIPSWVASMPWIPQWSPCTTIGSSCLDCSTRLICTKVGGMQKTCTDPSMPYCNLGKCSATPTVECAPPSETEAPTSA